MAMTPQFYKGDVNEKKFYNSVAPTSSDLELQKDLFYAGAYTCYKLGDFLYDTNRSPLTNAIKRDIFRQSFSAIFEAFYNVGTFEAYLIVFRKIFGDAVGVTFAVPAPGKLNISIVATGVELSHFVARTIENEVYVYSPMITQDGDNIVFQSIKGFTSEYELEQMLFEMVPGGIFTNITLSLES